MSDGGVFAAQTTVHRTDDGKPIGMRGTRDGALFTAPWLLALAMEGKVFGVGFGAAANEDTDPGTFGAGGVDLTEFDMLVTTPASGNKAIIPVFWKPVFEAIGTIAAADALLVYGTGGVVGANSVSITPANLRPDLNSPSGCTVAVLGDAAGTAITVGGYIYREGGTHLTGVAGTGQTLMLEWSYQKSAPPILVGASRQVAGFASAQASTGYMHFQWIELANSELE